MTVYGLKRFLTDIVYPNRCPFCGEIIAFDKYYCPDCLDNLDFYDGPEFIVFEYNGKSKPFINAIKEQGNGCAFAAAAKLIADRIGVHTDLIVPIPASKARMRLRGYNPPAMVARELSAITGIPYDAKLLIKTRQALVQKELDAKSRRLNLKGAFAVAENRKIADVVLVTDDVRVTGSTLSEAAEVLLAAGAKQVYTAAVAAVTSLDFRS